MPFQVGTGERSRNEYCVIVAGDIVSVDPEVLVILTEVCFSVPNKMRRKKEKTCDDSQA